MKDFEGRVAVITGAASGIGAALVEAALARGMKVMAADIEGGALDSAAVSFSALGEVDTHVCDVSDRDDVEALADATVRRFGSVHLVANNAGVSAGGASWEIEPAIWEWVVGVNLLGVVWGVRSFVPRIIESGGGHILNTASMAGLTSPPFMGPYNVAKHGVVTLSEGLAQELALAGHDVGVTVLCPGWVQTQIARSERNRPGAALTDEVNPFRDLVQSLIDGGLEPAQVAAMAFEAIESGTFAVLTHPEWKSGVVARANSLVDGRLHSAHLPGVND